MSNLLVIKASPRGQESYANRVVDVFLAAYQEKHPQDTISLLNVFEKVLPPFDGFAVQAKYSMIQGQKPTLRELKSWKAVEAIIAEFTQADKYVFSVPMWNFGIPYRLKHYIDLLVQPGYTFNFSPETGYKGLVPSRPVLLALSRGGEYLTGTSTQAFDLQKPYMETFLRFIGLTDIHTVIVEPTMRGRDIGRQKLDIASAHARKLAQNF